MNLLSTLFTNPQTPFSSYPFEQITPSSFRDVIHEAILEKREEIDAIVSNPEPPSFENTIVSLENSGQSLERICGAFYHLLHTERNEEYNTLAQDISLLLSQLDSDIYLNQALFKKIHEVYHNQDKEVLDEVDKRLLKQTYEAFIDHGSLLSEEKQKRYRSLRERHSYLSLKFSEYKINDENEWSLLIPLDTPSIQSLPAGVLQDAQQKAQEQSSCGYLFSLSAPHYLAIMKFCQDPDLRKTFYIARQSVGNQDNKNNNVPIIREIVNIRLEIAQLLGYSNYAEYVLKDRMLCSIGAVNEMLGQLQKAFEDTSIKEREELIREFQLTELNPWDISYYLEQYRERKIGIVENELRPYFPLTKVIHGIFEIANRLYGISFRKREDISVYHPDVQVFEALDQASKHLGLLYLDFFPRKGKQSGAWMTNLQEQEGEKRPHIALVMNFTPQTQGEALLTPSEVNTFLHEFGHSLHGMLTQCKYTSMSGTNVARDFVELPSQFMENFLTDPYTIQNILSEHYETGEPIATETLHRLIFANKYPVGYNNLRQLFFGYLDLFYHTRTTSLPENFSPSCIEEKLYNELPLWQQVISPCCISTGFSHIFSGGYAAGYYSYKWSEILETDTFDLFKRNGIWNPEIARRFRQYILEVGDSLDPMESYKNFRGQMPTPQALVERELNYSTIS